MTTATMPDMRIAIEQSLDPKTGIRARLTGLLPRPADPGPRNGAANPVAASRRVRIMRRIGAAGFAFFLVKGLLWLLIPAALWILRG